MHSWRAGRVQALLPPRVLPQELAFVEGMQSSARTSSCLLNQQLLEVLSLWPTGTPEFRVPWSSFTYIFFPGDLNPSHSSFCDIRIHIPALSSPGICCLFELIIWVSNSHLLLRMAKTELLIFSSFPMSY